MRIIFDHSIFSQQVYGGVSRYFYEISKEFSNMPGISSEIVAPLYINKYINRVDNNIFGMHAGRLFKANRVSSLVNDAVSPFVSFIKQPQIVHETYYSEKRLFSSRSKSVLTVYDMIHELHPESFAPSDKTSDLKRMAVDRVDHVICISENTKRDLIELFDVPEEKTSVVHLGFKLKNNDLIESTNAVGGFPYLLYVGNRGGYKNFISLLKAYSTSKLVSDGCRLVCFGGGAFSQDEQDAIAKCSLDTATVMHVDGDDSTLASLYSGATIFVYPSLYEGFGIPPLEAMSYGCPVVCSNTSSIPEVVGSAAEFFDPLSTDSLRASIEKVFFSEERSSQLVQLGRQRIERFSWERCARETLDLYRTLV